MSSDKRFGSKDLVSVRQTLEQPRGRLKQKLTGLS